MNSQSSIAEKSQAFLATASHFQLGDLPTERRHPRTMGLSRLAQSDPVQAVNLLKDIELEALTCIVPRLPDLEGLAHEIRSALSSGGRVFLCGCGATGRLSLSLETLWRAELARQPRAGFSTDSVISFIAGGDYALVRSIENFEDHPEYGARQLRELGFAANDLLISCTEGGETPFVIGATEEATQISRRPPYFLFCNPIQILKDKVERSRRVLENPGIRSICLETGPMAVAGSTRLQASTVLMLATGGALMAQLSDDADLSTRVRSIINDFTARLSASDLAALAPLIGRESDIYARGGYCLHRTTEYAITVLTDTTERAPTFSLVSFENPLIDPQPHPSWTYLIVRDSESAADAWSKILLRAPRPLTWSTFAERYGARVLPGFDFSPSAQSRRESWVGKVRQTIFDIDPEGEAIVFSLEELQARIPRAPTLLCEHLLLKVALNISSTLVMGRLGRFHGNLMHFVRSSNKKLIDRSIRCTRLLLEEEGLSDFSYDEICLALFEVLEDLPPGEPAVPKTAQRLRESHASRKYPNSLSARKAR